MRRNDTHKLLLVVYILTILFIFVLYSQGDLSTDPTALSTLQMTTGRESVQLMSGFQLNGESAVATVVTLTIFFGFAWVMSRSKSS